MGPPSTDDTERAGVHGVGFLVHRELQWKFREQYNSDFGIDAVLELADNGRPTGQLLALQIKSGQSWFRELANSPRGWVFRGSRRHLDYWLSYDLPVLVVLYDVDLRVAYWQQVSQRTIEVTGSGFKLTVPAGNRLEGAAVPALLNAATRRPTMPGEMQPPDDRGQPRRRDEVADWILGTRSELARVEEVTDRALLGIHAAISLPLDADASLSSDLPTYIPRDTDVELRAAVTAASRTGGFVLLVGTAASGKSRSAYEAIKSLLPQWRMLMPATVADLTELVVSGVALGRTVIWLDELANFLGPGRLTARLMRRLRVDASEPVLIIGSMWPTSYAGLHARPDPHTVDMAPDARQVLDLVTHRIWLSGSLSTTEHDRARSIAAVDPRIAEALSYETPQGLTSVLAAAPELIQRLHYADNYFGREVLRAAVNARRCGHPEPIPAPLLRGLAEALCLDSAQRAVVSADWFNAASKAACQPVREVSSPLWPIADRVGHVDGYAVSDILVQYSRQQPGNTDVPVEAVWAYLAEHAAVDACYAIGSSAAEAQQFGPSRIALERAAEAGHHKAMNNLGVVLAELGDDTTAQHWYRRAAEMGNGASMYNLALASESAGDSNSALQWYTRSAESGNDMAMFALGEAARESGALDAARTWYQAAVVAGNEDAINNLAIVLDEQGDRDGARRLYQQAIDSGSTRAMVNLGILLHEMGDAAGARTWYLKAAEAGNAPAMFALGNELVGLAEFESGSAWLNRAIEAGHELATNNLAIAHKNHGNIVQARTLLEIAANAGDSKAMVNLGDLLNESGDLDAACVWYGRAVDKGDIRAKYELGRIHARNGDLTQLRTWFHGGVEAGTGEPLMLGFLLARLGDLGTLRTGLDMALAAKDSTASSAIGLHLASAGDMEAVRVKFQEVADSGNNVPVVLISGLLIHFGHIDIVRGWFNHAAAVNDFTLTILLGVILCNAQEVDIVNVAACALAACGKKSEAEQLRTIIDLAAEVDGT